MNRAHIGVQAVIVLTMVVFVSWPQFRPLRAQSVWRYAPAVVQQAKTDDAATYSDILGNRTSKVGFGRASYTRTAPVHVDTNGNQPRGFGAPQPEYIPE